MDEFDHFDPKRYWALKNNVELEKPKPRVEPYKPIRTFIEGTKVKHATLAAYSVVGCRCEACTHWYERYESIYKLRSTTTSKRVYPPIDHGSIAMYTSKKYKCRCNKCKAAMKLYMVGHRRRKKEESMGLLRIRDDYKELCELMRENQTLREALALLLEK